jgi:hypothetical protein
LTQSITTTDALTKRATRAFAALIAHAPEVAADLYQSTFDNLVTNAEYPRLSFRPADPAKASLVASFIDPYTGEDTTLVVEDWAVEHTRVTDFNGVWLSDPAGPSLQIDFDHKADFDTALFKSSITDKPVRLPEGWRVQ